MRLLVGLFSAQTFVDGMLSVLIVVIALKLLDTGQAGVGFLNSAIGVGGLLGALAAAALVGRRRQAADFGLGIFIWGVPIASSQSGRTRSLCSSCSRSSASATRSSTSRG